MIKSSRTYTYTFGNFLTYFKSETNKRKLNINVMFYYIAVQNSYLLVYMSAPLTNKDGQHEY